MEMKDLVDYLKKNNLKISAMESCTGGAFISSLTNIEGASKVTDGGYITYSNKQKLLVGVPQEIIDTYGVYSTECAHAMATTCKELTGADVVIGITGTLSNIDTENIDSVKETVYYCIIFKNKNINNTINVPITDRKGQKEYIINHILSTLYTNIIIKQ